MEGFAVHTFRLVNAEGKSTFVKFHWKPKLGLQSVVWNEAVKINGADPDFHRRDLWDAIKTGDYPEWSLDCSSSTKLLRISLILMCSTRPKSFLKEEVPVRRVGRLVLDRCVDNFFAETEQVAFCTQNIVPEIDFSNDPLLQGRNFSDPRRRNSSDSGVLILCIFRSTRLSVRSHLFNRTATWLLSIQKAASITSLIHGAAKPAARGNLLSKVSAPILPKSKAPRCASGPNLFADHYSQARQFYKSQTPLEQNHLANALVFELSKVETPAISSPDGVPPSEH